VEVNSGGRSRECKLLLSKHGALFAQLTASRQWGQQQALVSPKRPADG
jgi:hypothetical protein